MNNATPNAAPTPSKPILLVNALRDRDVYVLREGRPVALPRVQAPFVIARTTSPADVSIAISDTLARPDGEIDTIELRLEGEATNPLILGDLPAREGVWYLVDPITKVQFPHREDFFVAQTYTMWTSRKYEKAKTKKERRKALKRDVKKYSHAQRFPLASISRFPAPIAGPETPVMTIDEEDGPDLY